MRDIFATPKMAQQIKMLLIMVMMILNIIVIAQHIIITLEEGNREAKT